MKPKPIEPSFLETQDRHVRQCLKEAKVVVVCWCIGLVSCTTIFVTMGYLPAQQRPPEPLLVWGVPAWVFWGLFFPWCIQISLACWFALRVMKDDEPYMEFPKPTGNDDEQPK